MSSKKSQSNIVYISSPLNRKGYLRHVALTAKFLITKLNDSGVIKLSSSKYSSTKMTNHRGGC